MCWINTLKWVEAMSRVELGHGLVMDWISFSIIYSWVGSSTWNGLVITLQWVGTLSCDGVRQCLVCLAGAWPCNGLSFIINHLFMGGVTVLEWTDHPHCNGLDRCLVVV